MSRDVWGVRMAGGPTENTALWWTRETCGQLNQMHRKAEWLCREIRYVLLSKVAFKFYLSSKGLRHVCMLYTKHVVALLCGAVSLLYSPDIIKTRMGNHIFNGCLWSCKIWNTQYSTHNNATSASLWKVGFVFTQFIGPRLRKCSSILCRNTKSVLTDLILERNTSVALIYNKTN